MKIHGSPNCKHSRNEGNDANPDKPAAGKHEAAMALAEVEGFDLSELFASDEGLGEEEDFEQE